MTSISRRARARLVAPVAALALAATAAPAFADWHEPVGGASPINQDSTRNATSTDLTTVDGVPHVVWNEDTTQPGAGSSSTIRVARLAADGLTWEKVGNAGTHPISRLDSTSSEHPSIADVGGVPWVAWEEGLTQTNQEIRVARLDDAGTGWVRVPDTLRPVNHLRSDPGGMGMKPTIVSDGGSRPYVSFMEVDPGQGSMFFQGGAPAKIWVMRLSADGTQWEEVGGGHVNPLADYDAAFPRMTVVDGVPWVTYFQVDVVDSNPVIGVRVSKLGGDGTWQQVGDPVLTSGPDGISDPDITTVAGTPYVAVPARLGDPEKRVRVFGLDQDGTGWTDLGSASPAGVGAETADIEAVDGLPWVAWHERGGTGAVGTTVLRDDTWQPIGTAYPPTGGNVADGPGLADVNGVPWFSFTQGDGQSPGSNGQRPCCDQVRVARLEPTFGGSSSQADSDSASLLTSVEDYGLPFPMGYQYGEPGSLDTTTTLAPRGDSPLLFRVVSGLMASTLYGFRPVATAGTPAPLVLGSTGYVVTDSAEGSPAPVLAITRLLNRVPQGEEQRVKFFSTRPGTLRMLVRGPDGTIVAERTRNVGAGVDRIIWRARIDGAPAPVGRYVVRLRLITGDGQRAADAGGFRVVPR